MEQARDTMATTMAAAHGASMRDLTEREVAERRARGLGNMLPPPMGRTYRQVVVENVFRFINIVIFSEE